MADSTPIQQSFAYGEMSPRLLGRTFTDRYQQSLRIAENVLTFSHGMAVKRPGTLFVGRSPSEGPTDIKLITLQPSPDQPYVLEVGDSYIALWSQTGYTNIQFVAPWLSAEVADIHYELDPTKAVMVLVHRNHPPHEFILNGPDLEADPPVFQAITFTSPPTEWAPGNYPGAVTFFQNRLWLASTPQQTDTLWASKPLSPTQTDFYNFDVGTGQADDAIAFEMADRGNIEWIRGARNLLIGCDVAEYIMETSSTDPPGAYIPGSLTTRQQSAFGSARIIPPDAYNGVLYVNSDLRRVRFMNYQFLEDGWVSLDITWPSEHVTRGRVKEIHYKQAPDPLIWLVLEDGTGVTCLYERDQENLVGFHRQPMPNANIKSVALTKVGADVETWFVVDRMIDGVEERYMEKTVAGSLDPTFTGTRIMSDSCLIRPVLERTLPNGNKQIYIDGLIHLASETVQLTVEEAQQALGVVDNEEVVLQQGFAEVGQNVVCGIQFIGRIQTLPLENITQGGSSQPTKKRYNKIFLRVLESAVPEINGIVTPARLPEVPANQTEPQFTGDVQVGNLGWDRFAQVDVRMPLARNYNILAVFGEATSNQL